MTNKEEYGEWNPFEDALDTYEASLIARDRGNEEESQRLLEKAAGMGWHEAEYDLAIQLLHRVNPSAESLETAIKFLKSASMFNPKAREKLKELTENPDN
jgi:hypothetical protein